MNCFSALKENEVVIYLKIDVAEHIRIKWIKLTVLKKDKYCMFYLVCDCQGYIWTHKVRHVYILWK